MMESSDLPIMELSPELTVLVILIGMYPVVLLEMVSAVLLDSAQTVEQLKCLRLARPHH